MDIEDVLTKMLLIAQYPVEYLEYLEECGIFRRIHKKKQIVKAVSYKLNESALTCRNQLTEERSGRPADHSLSTCSALRRRLKLRMDDYYVRVSKLRHTTLETVSDQDDSRAQRGFQYDHYWWSLSKRGSEKKLRSEKSLAIRPSEPGDQRRSKIQGTSCQ
uniref:CARD domain-containing protein n=1 Tax=Steinernema glaseri TaxID=37863 RepID=A0A1I8A396_9BILA